MGKHCIPTAAPGDIAIVCNEKIVYKDISSNQHGNKGTGSLKSSSNQIIAALVQILLYCSMHPITPYPWCHISWSTCHLAGLLGSRCTCRLGISEGLTSGHNCCIYTQVQWHADHLCMQELKRFDLVYSHRVSPRFSSIGLLSVAETGTTSNPVAYQTSPCHQHKGAECWMVAWDYGFWLVGMEKVLMAVSLTVSANPRGDQTWSRVEDLPLQQVGSSLSSCRIVWEVLCSLGQCWDPFTTYTPCPTVRIPGGSKLSVKGLYRSCQGPVTSHFDTCQNYRATGPLDVVCTPCLPVRILDGYKSSAKGLCAPHATTPVRILRVTGSFYGLYIIMHIIEYWGAWSGYDHHISILDSECLGMGCCGMWTIVWW